MADFPRDPVLLREVLDPLTARLGLGGARDMRKLWSRWCDVVGAAVAAHVEPTSFRDGVVRVRADSPTWATETTYLAETIRRGLNDALGTELVREIRVWSGPGPVRHRDRRRGDARVTAPATRGTPCTDDPRTAFERARGAWERRRRGRGEARTRAPQSGKSPW